MAIGVQRGLDIPVPTPYSIDDIRLTTWLSLEHARLQNYVERLEAHIEALEDELSDLHTSLQSVSDDITEALNAE